MSSPTNNNDPVLASDCDSDEDTTLVLRKTDDLVNEMTKDDDTPPPPSPYGSARCAAEMAANNTLSKSKVEIIDLDALKELKVKFGDSIEKDVKRVLDQIKRRLIRGNKHQVSYELPKKVSCTDEVAGIGRLSPVGGIGLQGLPRDVRSFLSSKNYFDLDIANSQPTICLQLFRMFKVEEKHCRILELFIENRESVYAALAPSFFNDRRSCKQAVLSLFFDFGAGGDTKVEKFDDEADAGLLPAGFTFEKFHSSISRGARAITSHEKWADASNYVAKVRDKSYIGNEEGTRFANVLQTVERQILLSIEAALKRNGREMDVLIHDGGFVRKLRADESKLPDSLIRICEAHVQSQTGFVIKLEVKPLLSSFAGDDVDAHDGGRDELFELQVEEFEKNWAFISHPLMFFTSMPKTRFLKCRDDDSVVRQVSNEMVRFDTIKEFLDLICYTNEGVIKGARFDAKKWMQTADKSNECSEIIMNPALPPGINDFGEEGSNASRCFNIFKGFSYPRPEEGDRTMSAEELELIKPWMDLHADLVGGDTEASVEDCVTFSTTWQAWLLQHPDIKTGVVVIYKGGFGDGKDLFIDEGVGSVIGRRGGYMTSNNIGKDILGDFNGPMEGKILIKGEELSFGDTTGNSKEELFKSYITCDTVQINDKNDKRFETQDFCNYAFTTNNSVPAAVASGDRRFCILKSRGVKREWDNWKGIRKHFDRVDFKKALAKYLWTFEIPPGWSPKDNRPKTESYAYAMLANAPAHAKALDAICALEKKEIEWNAEIEYNEEERSVVGKPGAIRNLINEQCALNGGGGSKGGNRYGQINLNQALREEYGMVEFKVGHSDEDKKRVVYPPVCIIRSNGINKSRIDLEAMTRVLIQKGWHEELR